MDRRHFDTITEKWGSYSSWAIWSWPDDIAKKPKSGMSDLTVFNSDAVIETLNPNLVLVALNFSTGTPQLSLGTPLSNFHGNNGQVYRLRYALRNTALWGGYMTDIIKDHIDPNSSSVATHLKNNPDFVSKNVEMFVEELNEVCVGPKILLVALGNDVHNILNKNIDVLRSKIRHEFDIRKITHYASQYERTRDEYSNRVVSQVTDFNINIPTS